MQLLGEDARVAQAPFLQDADNRDIREGLRECRITGAESTRLRAQQVHRPDHLPSQAHRGRVHRSEAPLRRCLLELWPGVARLSDIGHRDGFTALEAVDAGTQTRSKLHDLDELGLLARGGDEFERTGSVGDEEPSRVDVEQIGAHMDERREQVDDVVAVHQGVGHLHEGRVDLFFPRDFGHLALRSVVRTAASALSVIRAARRSRVDG